MSARSSKSSHEDKKPIQCFFRISIGGEILRNDIVIELDMENYPKTCESFLSLCDAKDSESRTSRQSPQPIYRGCEFHRVVPGLCVQAGDWERFDGTGGFSPLYGRNWDDEESKSANKIYNKHDSEGIVSMANTGKPNTNGSQFFVTLKPTPHLDRKHTAFGKVVSGMETVRKVADVERGERDHPVSLQRVVIEDCGRLSIGKVEEEDLRRSRSKEHKRKKKSRKRERKKRDKKRHRSRRHESSSSSESSASNSDDSDSEREERRRRERRSRKHRERKRQRKRYDSRCDDESSSDDDNSSRGQKHKRRRSSGDERDRRDRKKKERQKSRRKDKS